MTFVLVDPNSEDPLERLVDQQISDRASFETSVLQAANELHKGLPELLKSATVQSLRRYCLVNQTFIPLGDAWPEFSTFDYKHRKIVLDGDGFRVYNASDYVNGSYKRTEQVVPGRKDAKPILFCNINYRHCLASARAGTMLSGIKEQLNQYYERTVR